MIPIPDNQVEFVRRFAILADSNNNKDRRREEVSVDELIVVEKRRRKRSIKLRRPSRSISSALQ